MSAYRQLRRPLKPEGKDALELAKAFYRSWFANARDGLVSLQDIPYALDDACAELRANSETGPRTVVGRLSILVLERVFAS
jgi:hypothetical protein